MPRRDEPYAAPRPADRPTRVLRLASVFEPRHGDVGAAGARYDPIGGMQNHTGTLSRALDALGVRQTVITARLGGRRGVDPLGEHGSVVRVGTRLPVLRQLWALCALPTVLAAVAAGDRADVVHAHQGEDLAVLPLALLASRVNGARLVVTVHCSVRHTLRGGTPRARLLRLAGGTIEARVLRRADAVVVLAERTARLLRADGVAAARVSVIPSGFDPGLFGRARPDRFGHLPRPRIGYVGRLAAQKRPDLAVEALAKMRTRAHLLVVGDGPDRDHLRDQVASSPVADRITLHGFVEHDEVPGVLASLDVLVLPSAYEELGSVLVEALAAGLPAVATRVGGIPEVVLDGVTGLLVEPGDADALAAALDRVLADPELASRLRRGSREQAARWSWPELAGAVADVYAGLVAARAPAPPRAPASVAAAR